MSEATATSPAAASQAAPRVPTFFDLCDEWHKSAEKWDKLNRLITTDAKIAQTPKELVWTLNKADRKSVV